MWDVIFLIVFGVGAVLARQAYSSRDRQTEPYGVGKGTPAREWPAISPREALGYRLALHWKACLMLGLALALAGVGGRILVAVTDASGPASRDDVIDAVSADPSNTLDPGELNCMLDFMEDAGIDITTTTEDELLRDLGSALSGMDAAELDRYTACFDAESSARADQRASELSDEQLRRLFVEAQMSDPVEPLDRSTAECILEVLEERGVLRDLITADEQLTPGLEAALVYSDTVCR